MAERASQRRKPIEEKGLEEEGNANRVYKRVGLKKNEEKFGTNKFSDEKWREFAVVQDEVGMAFGRGRGAQ